MAITFVCGCGKSLRASEELAGRRSKCPRCGEIFTIPERALDKSEPVRYVSQAAKVEEPDSGLIAAGSMYEDAAPVYSQAHGSKLRSRPGMSDDWAARDEPQAGTLTRARAAKSAEGGRSSLLEYSYLLLFLALIPLMISLLGNEEKTDIQQRFAKSVAKASPQEQTQIERVLSKGEISLDEALAALPGGKLDGAHLARDSSTHWVYAAIAAVAFLLLLGLCFSVERAQALHLLGIGAFTGTVGIIFLLAVQFCSNFRFRHFGGRGIVMAIMLFLMFIGWSYGSANDPDSNFLLSALGFTFGIGLCEEFTKAIPLLFSFKERSTAGWRVACVWGLASGIGFGVSEGIMYSSRHYNGIGGVDIYLVRFISCVALHAMWSASVGIAIARNVDEYESAEDFGGYFKFIVRVMAVPMVLHGFYDTLLKKEMNAWALAVALLSFGWLVWHIELARSSQPKAGRLALA